MEKWNGKVYTKGQIFREKNKTYKSLKKKMYVFTEFRMENLVRAFSFIIYDGTLDGDRPSAPPYLQRRHLTFIKYRVVCHLVRGKSWETIVNTMAYNR